MIKLAAIHIKICEESMCENLKFEDDKKICLLLKCPLNVVIPTRCPVPKGCPYIDKHIANYECPDICGLEDEQTCPIPKRDYGIDNIKSYILRLERNL